MTKMGWWSGSRCRPKVQAPVLEKKKRKRKKAQACKPYPRGQGDPIIVDNVVNL
jgi:hypothetical protein